VFSWIMGETEAPRRARIEPGAAEIVVRSRELPMGVPVRSRAPLEIIRFAAANHLCVDLQYDGDVRRIEPYSLRQTEEGNYVLHSIRSDSGQHRSYRVDRIEGASVTGQSFAPRYLVELTPEGPLPVSPAASGPRTGGVSASGRRPARRRRPGTSFGNRPIYVFRCVVCGKNFQRRSMDGSLNAHKHPTGYECPGRVGSYVRTKY
jgi:hypothetical protein